MHYTQNDKIRQATEGQIVVGVDIGLLFTGRADIKNDMLSLQSISVDQNQTSTESSWQSETGRNLFEQIQLSEPKCFEN